MNGRYVGWVHSPPREGQLPKLAAVFNKANSPPCIAARSGVRAIKENIAKHPLLARTGWFSDRTNKEHHPGCVNKDASRHFLDDAATPPRGDARRGMALSKGHPETGPSRHDPCGCAFTANSAMLIWTAVPREEGWTRHQEKWREATFARSANAIARSIR